MRTAVAEAKTKVNDASVDEFLDKVADPKQREDARVILKLMRDITGEMPKMWGSSIIGFGQYHYKYDSGHEGDCCMTGFSPRKTSLTLYLMPGFELFADLMNKLGKYKTGKSCLYIKRLADVDQTILAALIRAAFERCQQSKSAPNAASTEKPTEKKKTGKAKPTAKADGKKAKSAPK